MWLTLLCVCAHTSLTRHPLQVVVGEKGNDPNLYVFEYPSWQVVKVLKKGAVRGYSCLAFSPDGNKLASVAMVCTSIERTHSDARVLENLRYALLIIVTAITTITTTVAIVSNNYFLLIPPPPTQQPRRPPTSR